MHHAFWKCQIVYIKFAWTQCISTLLSTQWIGGAGFFVKFGEFVCRIQSRGEDSSEINNHSCNLKVAGNEVEKQKFASSSLFSLAKIQCRPNIQLGSLVVNVARLRQCGACKARLAAVLPRLKPLSTFLIATENKLLKSWCCLLALVDSPPMLVFNGRVRHLYLA